MSTKTVALDTRVYERLAALKREGESFSKAIDRLLTEVGSAHTGDDILNGLSNIPPLSDSDSAVFLEVVAENRDDETWNDGDLR